MGRRLMKLLLVALAAGPVLAALSGSPAAGAAPGESISSYDVTMTVRSDGTLHVREKIAYDFGIDRRHGIYRTLPTTQRYNDRYNRVYRLSHVTVASPDGAPTQTDVIPGDQTVIKIGDPARTITGAHTYVLDYDIAGAMNGFADHQELYWNAIGAEWAVPISSANATVEMPAEVNRVACFSGPRGSNLPCTSSAKEGQTATFAQASLSPYQAFTVVVGVPKGTVPAGPILVKRPSLRQAFALTPVTLGGFGAILLLIGAGIGRLVWSRGRDRRYAGQVPGLAPAPGQPNVQEYRPLFTRPDGAVEFAPPDGVRPGQVGTLIDEKADVLDVTATIVDLAVRKYIHIEELPPPPTGYGGRDWRLSVAGQPDETLLPYERMLLAGLFRWGSVVYLSQLRFQFHPTMSAVRSQLYDDLVRQGWFARRPDRVRNTWAALGVALAVIGLFVTVALVIFTELALVGVGVLLGGVALAGCARFLPARTARGSGVLARVRGFRQYLKTAEAEQLKYEERELILSRYLPYAIVFGETERLARAFATLNAGRPPGTGLYWYSGPGAWDLAYFGSAISSFTFTTSSTLVSTPPMASSSSASGSSGFSGGSSGGGGGGGGGGSW